MVQKNDNTVDVGCMESRGAFIKRFRTDQGFYVYDVNTNKILRVSPEMYAIVEDFDVNSLAELKAAHQSEFRKNEIEEAYEKLMNLNREHGLFSSNRPRKMSHGLCDEHFNWHLDNTLGQLILEATTRCNLSCRYCVFSGAYEHTRTHGKEDMPSEIAFKAIDYFLSHSEKSENRSIGFYGGEPLLNLPLIRDCVEYARKKAPGRDIMFHMTTNGTLLTEEVCRYLIGNDVGFMVSIDGPKRVHDGNRIFPNGRGSYETVVANLKRIWAMDKEWCERHVSTTCVITDTFGSKETYRFFNDPRKRDMCGMFIQPSGVDQVNLRRMRLLPPPEVDARKEQGELYELFIEKLLKRELKPREEDFLRAYFQSSFLKLYKRRETDMGDRVSVNGMCVPGWRKIFVDVLGNIHPCERVNRKFIIGHVDTSLDKDKVRAVIEMQVEANRDRCLRCWAVRLCGACLASLNGDGKIDLDARNWYCENEKAQWETTLSHYTQVLELRPEAFDYMEDIVVS